MKFNKLLNQGWRRRAARGQLFKNLILLLLIIYVIFELKGFLK